jgi:hypothetical protein
MVLLDWEATPPPTQPTRRRSDGFDLVGPGETEQLRVRD